MSTVGELRKLSLSKLQSSLWAKTGQHLFKMARGRDERKVQVEHVRKTVSAEVNYGIRFASWREAETFLGQLAGEVAERLQKVIKKILPVRFGCNYESFLFRWGRRGEASP